LIGAHGIIGGAGDGVEKHLDREVEDVVGLRDIDPATATQFGNRSGSSAE
jgi:hypothetical protein